MAEIIQFKLPFPDTEEKQDTFNDNLDKLKENTKFLVYGQRRLDGTYCFGTSEGSVEDAIVMYHHMQAFLQMIIANGMLVDDVEFEELDVDD